MSRKKKSTCLPDRRGAHKTAERKRNIIRVKAWYSRFPKSTVTACMAGLKLSRSTVERIRKGLGYEAVSLINGIPTPTYKIDPSTGKFSKDCLGVMVHNKVGRRDLIPAFQSSLENTPYAISSEYLPADPHESFWLSNASAVLFVRMFEVLNRYAPDGYVFGTDLEERDNWGFWEAHEESLI